MESKYTKEQVNSLIKARLFTNLAYVMADCAESYMVEVDSNLNKLHQSTRMEERKKFKDLGKQAKALHDRLKAIGGIWKDISDDEKDSAFDDSDFFYKLIILIAGALIVGGGYDSNVNNDIGIKEFTLPSLNIPLSGNEKKKDGYGFSTFVLNHSYDFGERGGWSLENSFVAYDKLYSQSSKNNLVLLSLSSAPTWSENDYKVSLPLTFDRVYIDGRGYLYNVGAGITNSYLIDPLSQIEGGYSFKRGYYNEETHDVNAHLLFANYRRIIGDNLFALALHTSYGINKEVESIRTDVQNKEWKYGLDLSKEFTKTFRSALSYTHTSTDYDDVDTLFLTKRQDEKDQYELSFGYTLQKNLSLGMSIMYSDNRSNHDPYDYDKINALASIMWTF
jgi:hypothetical protein